MLSETEKLNAVIYALNRLENRASEESIKYSIDHIYFASDSIKVELVGPSNSGKETSDITIHRKVGECLEMGRKQGLLQRIGILNGKGSLSDIGYTLSENGRAYISTHPISPEMLQKLKESPWILK